MLERKDRCPNTKCYEPYCPLDNIKGALELRGVIFQRQNHHYFDNARYFVVFWQRVARQRNCPQGPINAQAGRLLDLVKGDLRR